MRLRLLCALLTTLAAGPGGHAAETVPGGDAEAGRQVFRACVSCHSLEAGRHMTGPSLATVWDREAGTVAGFARYSDALKRSGIIWNETSLDGWLVDPQGMVPGTRMIFPGLPDAGQRRDLIAFLYEVSQAGGEAAGGMSTGGMMGGGGPIDLKALEANNRVTAIKICGDTYTVTAENGEIYQFWEFNLRFKTDSSDRGPPPGHPVIVPGGMRGDRASVIFATPGEISGFIKTAC